MKLALADPRIVCVDSDMGGLESTFGARLPERYINVGIAEANMFGVAAGLAARGKIPYVNTMAGFATARAAEQLKLDVAANELPVRVVATHGGVAAAHFGPTHYALEDLAFVRTLQQMTAIVPADACETELALREAHNLSGPVYLRLGRLATPPVHERAPALRLGKAVMLRDGADVTLIATGPYPVIMAVQAADKLRNSGIYARVLDMHTLVPLDLDALRQAAVETAGIITVEEHRPQGGLGDAVSEVVSEKVPCPLIRVAMRGHIAAQVDDQRGIMESSGVSTEMVLDAIKRVFALRSRCSLPRTSSRSDGEKVQSCTEI